MTLRMFSSALDGYIQRLLAGCPLRGVKYQCDAGTTRATCSRAYNAIEAKAGGRPRAWYRRHALHGSSKGLDLLVCILYFKHWCRWRRKCASGSRAFPSGADAPIGCGVLLRLMPSSASMSSAHPIFVIRTLCAVIGMCFPACRLSFCRVSIYCSCPLLLYVTSAFHALSFTFKILPVLFGTRVGPFVPQPNHFVINGGPLQAQRQSSHPAAQEDRPADCFVVETTSRPNRNNQ
jgi:hypothetical protein